MTRLCLLGLTFGIWGLGDAGILFVVSTSLHVIGAPVLPLRLFIRAIIDFSILFMVSGMASATLSTS